MKNLICLIAIISFGLVAVGCGGDDSTTQSPSINGKTPNADNPGSNEEAGGAKPMDPL